MSDQPEHKYDFGQVLEVTEGNYPPQVQVMAKLDGHLCTRHSAPYYGCSAGNDHFTLCEALLRPANKRKMN